MTTAATLVQRARTAANARGLSTERLDCLALGYGIRTGPWKGELLDLVREAWGDQRIFVEASAYSELWAVNSCTRPLRQLAVDAGEVEALIAALEAAPLSLIEALEAAP